MYKLVWRILVSFQLGTQVVRCLVVELLEAECMQAEPHTLENLVTHQSKIM